MSGSNSSSSNISFPWDDETVYKEVTEPFLSACSDLEIGEILHNPSFSLMQAMSAIELMDPVMDAWVSRPQRKPYTFESALESGHLKIKDLTLSERIGIVDESLLCLVSWLEGHFLADTVLTNLYLHSPMDIPDLLLRSASIGILKLVAIIKSIIGHSGATAEEDFQLNTFGVNFFDVMKEDQLTPILKEAEEDLQRTIRKTKAKGGPGGKEEHIPQSEGQESELASGLLARIRFIRLLNLGLHGISMEDMDEGRKRLSLALEQIPTILSTLKFGIARENYEEGLLPGFDPLAIQGLLPRTYLGVTKLKPREPSIIYLKDMIQRLIHAISVTSLSSFHALFDFYMDFGQNGTCVLSRTVLQYVFQPYKYRSRPSSPSHTPRPYAVTALYSLSFADFLEEDCKSFIAPPALMNQKNPQVFLTSLFDAVGSFMARALYILGHNIARQRDKIASLLNDIWLVQDQAEKLDVNLNHGSSSGQMLHFSTWVLYHILRFMIRYLLLGFELELYSNHEFPYIYWYLYELLYPWLTSCLFRAETHLLRFEQLNESQQHHGPGKNKKKLKSNSKKKSHPHTKEATAYQGLSILCAGYFKLLVGLNKTNKMLSPDSEFDNVKVRYKRRFAPFSRLLYPPLMPYRQYVEVYDHFYKWDSSTIFSAAAKDFASSRKIFEISASSPSKASGGASSASGGGLTSTEEFNKLVTVAKNNFVVSSILAKDSKRNTDFDFSLHRNFPVIKFV